MDTKSNKICKRETYFYVVKLVSIVGIIGICMCICLGCSTKKISIKKKCDIDFTVVEQSDIPAKLSEEIANKKENGFKLTYSDGNYMYIAIGYGARDTGGYNVQVKELFMTSNAIYINSSLVGPRENDMVLKATTYPYIVVKIEDNDMNVVFNT